MVPAKPLFSKCLNGLFKPTAGEVIVDGLNSRQTSIVQMVKRVGYVFQTPIISCSTTTVGMKLHTVQGTFNWMKKKSRNALKKQPQW
jgi:energy-coupling factor transporter ATP-binding protein EcfA2